MIHGVLSTANGFDIFALEETLSNKATSVYPQIEQRGYSYSNPVINIVQESISSVNWGTDVFF